jgi:UDP-3-O-[3-hydroxymyristoyl] N-acetylglucosamine deacetylase/3-hydroxyacyl-[acyl-carrier-protein] dehydratase
VIKGPQKTIKGEFQISGTGLHSGQPVRVRVLPADPGTGFIFRRTDLEGSPEVPFRPDCLIELKRRTALKCGEAEIHTSEHLIAGLFGIGVDNALIEIDGPEPPAVDGSAGAYSEAALAVGLIEQSAERDVFTVREPIAVGGGESALTLLPANGAFRIEYTLDYGVPELPANRIGWSWTPEGFAAEIAPARTFCLASEVAALKAAGYGKGADSQNTLVVADGGTVIENKLRWPDEFTRHKILDVIGDLALSGCRIEGRVVAVRSGHQLNQEVARLVRDYHDAELLEGTSKSLGGVDPQELLKYAPHRYPFLMIDRIVRISADKRRITAIKNVTFNEPYFMGHFPEQPVMPGVMQIEAMAQAAGIVAMMQPENDGKLGLLTAVESARFRRGVLPGDRLRIEAEVLRSRRGIVEARAVAFVGHEQASEATIKFVMAPKVDA